MFLHGELEFRTLQGMCQLCPELNKLILLESGVGVADRNVLDKPIQTEISTCFSRLQKVLVPSWSIRLYTYARLFRLVTLG